jgi:hypothetical protein
MPDWEDPMTSRLERYYLSLLIRDNEQLANEILNTFIRTDVLKWETLVYLDHIEPCENLKENKVSKYERPLTPIETIYIYEKSSLVIHPVVKTLIDQKYYDFVQYLFWIETIRSISLVVLWTVFSVYENFTIKHYYNLPIKYDKLILLIFLCFFFAWDVVEEVSQIYYAAKRLNGYRRWAHREYKNLRSNKKREDATMPKIDHEKKLKYSLVDKEIRDIKNLPNPYNNIDNVNNFYCS